MRKLMVEESLTLDAQSLLREGALKPGTATTISWTQGGQPYAAIALLADEEGIWLDYMTSTQRTDQQTDEHYHVAVLRVPASVGGLRAFFKCPRCHERVCKLHRPPSERRFDCRRCHELSYLSRQRRWPSNHRWLDRLENIDQEIERIGKLLDRPRRGRGRPSKATLRQEAAAIRHQRAAEAAQVAKRSVGRPTTKRGYQRRLAAFLSPWRPSSQAWCPRCRDRRELQRPKLVVLASGRAAVRGYCGTCRTETQRIVSQAAFLSMTTGTKERHPADAEVALAG